MSTLFDARDREAADLNALMGRLWEAVNQLMRCTTRCTPGRQSFDGRNGQRWVADAWFDSEAQRWLCGVESPDHTWVGSDPSLQGAFARAVTKVVIDARVERKQESDQPADPFLCRSIDHGCAPSKTVRVSLKFKQPPALSFDAAMALARRLSSEFALMLTPPAGQETSQTRDVEGTEYRVRLTVYPAGTVMAFVLDRHSARAGYATAEEGTVRDCIAYATEEAIRQSAIAAAKSSQAEAQPVATVQLSDPGQPAWPPAEHRLLGWEFL